LSIRPKVFAAMRECGDQRFPVPRIHSGRPSITALTDGLIRRICNRIADSAETRPANVLYEHPVFCGRHNSIIPQNRVSPGCPKRNVLNGY
jgi:hypothetical protein